MSPILRQKQKKKKTAWWCMPVIPAFGRGRSIFGLYIEVHTRPAEQHSFETMLKRHTHTHSRKRALKMK